MVLVLEGDGEDRARTNVPRWECVCECRVAFDSRRWISVVNDGSKARRMGGSRDLIKQGVVQSGKWKVESGRWKVESGRWKGRWKCA